MCDGSARRWLAGDGGTSVGDGLAGAPKADLNWKLQISNNQCGLNWWRSSFIK